MDEDKQLKLEGLRGNLTNTEKEIKNIGEAVKEVENKKRLLEEQIELRKSIHALAQANFGIVSPKWTWETLPEYTELNKRLSDNEFQFKLYELQGFVKQVERNIKNLQDQVDSQEEAKKHILAEIAALEEA